MPVVVKDQESDYVDPYDAYMDSLPRGQQNKAMGHYRPKQPSQQRATLRVVKPEKRKWVSVKILRAVMLVLIWTMGAALVIHGKVLEFLGKGSFYLGQALINYTGKPKEGGEEITET